MGHLGVCFVGRMLVAWWWGGYGDVSDLLKCKDGGHGAEDKGGKVEVHAEDSSDLRPFFLTYLHETINSKPTTTRLWTTAVRSACMDKSVAASVMMPHVSAPNVGVLVVVVSTPIQYK